MSKNFFSKLKENLFLLLINFKVKIINFITYLRIVFKYYSNFSFLKIDSYLVFSYLFNNPFSISKRFLLNRGDKEVYTYGETPLTTFEQIIKECRLTNQDIVVELGCGRGRTCFWLNQFLGCDVIGIDYVPEFIKRANQIKEKFNIPNIEFREDDLLTSDLTGATVIYLYGTCFDGSFIKKLIEHFTHLPRGTKIITVSYALSEYTNKPLFEVMKRFPAMFTWGNADVYLQIKK